MKFKECQRAYHVCKFLPNLVPIFFRFAFTFLQSFHHNGTVFDFHTLTVAFFVVSSTRLELVPHLQNPLKFIFRVFLNVERTPVGLNV